jgi:hypothetical protein
MHHAIKFFNTQTPTHTHKHAPTNQPPCQAHISNHHRPPYKATSPHNKMGKLSNTKSDNQITLKYTQPDCFKSKIKMNK